MYADALHVSDKYFVLGENTVQVTLNAHSHGDWTYDGVVIADIVTVMHEKNGNRELFTSKQSQ